MSTTEIRCVGRLVASLLSGPAKCDSRPLKDVVTGRDLSTETAFVVTTFLLHWSQRTVFHKVAADEALLCRSPDAVSLLFTGLTHLQFPIANINTHVYNKLHTRFVLPRNTVMEKPTSNTTKTKYWKQP